MLDTNCANCGAAIKIKGTAATGSCQYCGGVVANPAYVPPAPPQPAQKPPIIIQSPPPQTRGVPPQNAPPRPRISGCLCVLLFFFGFWPGILYLVYVTHQQHAWDEKYGRR